MRFHTIALALIALVLIASCSDDSTTPQDEHAPARFSRMFGSYGQQTRIHDVIVLSDGLRVVAGAFRGVLHITASSDSVTAATMDDFFLAAFRPDGSLAWKRTFPNGNLYSCKLARDGSDNLYMAGSYGGSTNVAGTDLSDYGLNNVMIARLDSESDPVWVQGSGSGDNDFALDCMTAADGGMFVCGIAGDEMTIAGEDMGQIGKNTGFLVKVNPNGVGSWAATAATSSLSSCNGVTRAANGDVLVVGSYAGTVDIGGEVLPAGAGTRSMFIARFSNTGDPVRNLYIPASTASAVYPNAIVQANGKIVVVGGISGTADFDVTSGAGEMTSAGTNAFVALYSDDGAFQWARTFGSADPADISAVTYTGSDLVIAGGFEGTLTLDATDLTDFGQADVFVAHLNLGGDVTRAYQIGSNEFDYVLGLTAAGGRAIVAGTAEDIVTFPNGDVRKRFGTLDGFVYQE
jgi:hypothetical protein